MAKLTAAQRREMPAKEFAGGKGGKAGATGRFPLNDKAHIRAAESYERFATPTEKKRIDAAAKKAFGQKDSSGDRRKNGPGGEVRHPQSHQEFEDL
jgi:hypothetical protein